MTNSNNLLTRTECSAMRGVAILGIMLHNYCHWLGFAVKENEYTFTQHNVDGLLVELTNPSVNLIVHLLSFFGHYGVPVFLFLSAYGLTLKYAEVSPQNGETGFRRKGQDLNAWSFIWQHFKKLWWMMIVGFALFAMVDNITPMRHHYEFMDVVAQLGLFNNLLPDPDHIIWPGPYWFFGLMMQLYIVYRLLLYKRHWGITVALMVICTALQMFCAPESEELNRLRYNCIGGILPFGLGLLVAKPTQALPGGLLTAGKMQMFNSIILLVSVILIFWLGLYYWTWFFVPIVVCSFAVALVKLTPAKINNLLAWVGGISSAMFVCHPITRKIFIPISRHGDVFTGLLLYIIATFVLSMIFQRLMKIVKL